MLNFCGLLLCFSIGLLGKAHGYIPKLSLSPGTDGKSQAVPQRGSQAKRSLELEVVKPNSKYMQSEGPLKYNGGKVLTKVAIQPIFYNGLVNFQSEIVSFYQALVGAGTDPLPQSSPYMDFLASLYSTTRPQQNIQYGSVAAALTAQIQETSIDQATLEEYLVDIIAKEKIEVTDNTVLAVHLPPGVSVTVPQFIALGGGDLYANYSDFASFHATITLACGQHLRGGKASVHYMLVQDQSTQWASGPYFMSPALDETYAITAFELAKVITNPFAGVSIVRGKTGWAAPTTCPDGTALYSTVADAPTLTFPLQRSPCTDPNVIYELGGNRVVLSDGISYPITPLYSNVFQTCIMPIANYDGLAPG